MAAFDHNGLPGSALDRELRGLNCARCDRLSRDLAAAQEAIKAARLFIAETGDKLPDPMYIETVNREGLAEDCKQFATGEVCAKYLDVKWQTERAIRAEDQLAQAQEARQRAEDELRENESVIAVWRGRTERAEALSESYRKDAEVATLAIFFERELCAKTAEDTEKDFPEVADEPRTGAHVGDYWSGFRGACEEIAHRIRARSDAVEQAAAQEARQRAEALAEEYRKDAERLDWLEKNPRHAQIVVSGVAMDCVFYGISTAELVPLRAAIDAAREGK